MIGDYLAKQCIEAITTDHMNHDVTMTNNDEQWRITLPFAAFTEPRSGWRVVFSIP